MVETRHQKLSDGPILATFEFLKEIFFLLTPSILTNHLPTSEVVSFALLVNVCFLGGFVWFSIQSVGSLYHAKYASFEQSSGQCNVIPKSITDTYYMKFSYHNKTSGVYL